MRNSITHLQEISKKNTRLILGLMSGTSLDGLDMALCRFEGCFTDTKMTLCRFSTKPYGKEYQQQLLTVFSKEKIRLQDVCILNPWIGRHHAHLIRQQLAEWKIDSSEIDVIASHGQTIFHAPFSLHQREEMPNSTLQIGDADHIAEITKIITVSDFRQKQIACGGEGAPLVIYGDFLLGASEGEHRILLNIGGISNLTYLPKTKQFDEVICSDVGPGNTIIDAYVQKYFPTKTFDKDAKIALKGHCSLPLLEGLLSHPYFTYKLPKTSGPELFNLDYLEQAQRRTSTEDLTNQDVLCTLTHFSAHVISDFIIRYLPKESYSMYVSGGGYWNPLLIKTLESLLGKSVCSTAQIGLNPDAKEAILFACLANEMLSGEHREVHHPYFPWMNMGKISFPR